MACGRSRGKFTRPDPAAGEGAAGAAHLALRQGDYRQARAWSEQRLAIGRALDDDKLVAAALHGLGNVDSAKEKDEQATSHFEDALTLFQKLSDGEGVSTAILMLGAVEHNRGDLERATMLLEQAAALSR